MLKGRHGFRDWRTPAEKFRAEHERWLNHALRRPDAYPRIPARPVHAGGYDRMRNRASGLAWAERWWRIALERVGLS